MTIDPFQKHRAKHIQTAFLYGMLFTFLMASSAHAGPVHTVMGNVLCTIVYMVYGNLGKAIATLAIMIIGVGATLGKTSWGLAMIVGVGISVVFGAGIILDQLAPALATGGVCPIV